MLKLNNYQLDVVKKASDAFRALGKANYFEETLKTLTSQPSYFKALQESAQSFSKQMADSIARAVITQEKWVEAILPTVQAMNRLQECFLKPAKEMAALAEKMKMAIQLEKTSKAWEKLERELIAIGWFPVGDWTAIDARYLIKLFSDGETKKIDNYIFRYFSEKRLMTIIKKWTEGKKIKKNRLRVLERTIRAHLRREYDLAIIASLTQIEGVIRMRIKEYRDSGHSRILKRYQKRLKRKLKDSPGKADYAELIHKGILSKLFLAHGKSKKSKKVIFTRHSVIHGFNVKDFNRINSLKLILLLDCIISEEVFVG